MVLARDVLELRSSPTLEGRCCRVLRVAVRRHHEVAILTDPGGPVLLVGAFVNRSGPDDVAILTDPGGPVLLPLRWHQWVLCPECCDPHRPWRAGAAVPHQGCCVPEPTIPCGLCVQGLPSPDFGFGTWRVWRACCWFRGQITRGPRGSNWRGSPMCSTSSRALDGSRYRRTLSWLWSMTCWSAATRRSLSVSWQTTSNTDCWTRWP